MKRDNKQNEMIALFGKMYIKDRLTAKEIADKTGYSINTVRSYLAKGNFKKDGKGPQPVVLPKHDKLMSNPDKQNPIFREKDYYRQKNIIDSHRQVNIDKDNTKEEKINTVNKDNKTKSNNSVKKKTPVKRNIKKENENPPYVELDPPYVFYNGAVYEKLSRNRLRTLLMKELKIKG